MARDDPHDAEIGANFGLKKNEFITNRRKKYKHRPRPNRIKNDIW